MTTKFNQVINQGIRKSQFGIGKFKQEIAIIFFLFVSILDTTVIYGQKKQIDEEACRNWSTLLDSRALISGNGKFAAYRFGTPTGKSTLVIHAINGNFEKSLNFATEPAFSDNSSYFFARLPGDTLILFSLNNLRFRYLTNISSYSLHGKWLLYFQIGSNKQASLLNLETQKSKVFPEAGQVQFNKQGTSILIHSQRGLTFLDLETGEVNELCDSKNTTGACFNEKGNAVAYCQRDMNEKCSVFYWSKEMVKPKLIINNLSPSIEKGYQISYGELQFSPEGKLIYFRVFKDQTADSSFHSGPVITNSVNIWSYKDKQNQIAQNELFSKGHHLIDPFLAVVNINTGQVIRLEDVTLKVTGKLGDKYVLLSTPRSSPDFYWQNGKKELFAVSLSDGSRTKILSSNEYPGFDVIGLDPEERLAVWFDPVAKQYFSYDFATKKVISFTKDIQEPFILSERGDADLIRQKYLSYGNLGWNILSNSLIIYSAYDIWQVDPAGKKLPINLTNGYGRKNRIRFRILCDDRGKAITYRPNKILLSALNKENKDNGFWTIKLNSQSAPEKLIMDKHAYHFEGAGPRIYLNSAENINSFKPVKAANASTYLVRRMSADQSANIFTTKDFKTFTQISNIHPESTYKWFKSQLITWKLPDGESCQGILYVPEELEPSKKYPVIFNYYEKRSDNLNLYRTPSLFADNINVPWYLSRGYLVFEPDFYFKQGEVSRCIIETVESAAKKLGALSFVDTSRMGCQGQSFGGYETNVIVAGTKIFKAASEMAGPSDLFSEYGSIRPGGLNNQYAEDMGQRNIGAFPWDKPDVFIANSPALLVNRISTPLLIVHNQGDLDILWAQGIEMFMNMRRIGKKVWMLDYDGEGHGLFPFVKGDYENRVDCTLRIQQFFDYYLKDAPPPKWMTRPIPASKKGISSGLQLDTSGAQP